MLKKLIAIAAMTLFAAHSWAVDVNKATAAELDAVKGIGPGISAKILDERKKGQFKDWDDLITRVQGVGETNATKFSEGGMTVGGAAYKGAMAKPAAKEDKPMAAKKEEKPMAAKKDEKPMAAKAEEKKADAKPVAAAAPAAMPAKEDKKAMAADEKKAKAAEDKKAMAEKKDAKKDEKTTAVMPKKEEAKK
jgi:competence protein ComEA